MNNCQTNLKQPYKISFFSLDSSSNESLNKDVSISKTIFKVFLITVVYLRVESKLNSQYMKLKYTYIFFVVISIWILMRSNSSGRTGVATPLATCTGAGCHTTTAGANAFIDSLLVIDPLTGLSVTQYTPGKVYRVALFGRSTSIASVLPKFGFVVGNGGKGTFSGASSGATTTGTYWGHTTPKDTLFRIPPIFTNIYFDSCTWTAPSAGSGNVTMQARINAVNNDGTTSGDASNSTLFSKILTEFNNTAGVTITASGGNSVCQGANKTFIATPTNGGTTPTYQWYINSTAVGTGGNSYTTNTLVNGDTVYVVMTSSISGITNNPATSNKIRMTVNPAFVNNVSIMANKSNACAGDTVIFNATISPGSTGAQYRWFRNQTQVAGPPTSSATYTQVGLTAGDSFSCRVQINNACATPPLDTSNFVKITVNTSPVITGFKNDTICTGDSSVATNWQSTMGSTTYTWTNSNPAIGLPASGSGQIPKFKAPDNIAMPQITATITINSFAGGCKGAPVTYTIFVRRKPAISVSNAKRAYCPGETGNITLAATPTAGTSLSWTNDNPLTGIAMSGTNGFINFTATNPTNDTIVSNIVGTVTQTNGCRKDTNFKVVVYPAPSTNTIPDFTTCIGGNVPSFIFASPTSGATFTWVNSNTAIGLGASGSGNTPAFTATNSTSGTISGTVTVKARYGTCDGPNMTFKINVETSSTASITIDTKDTGLCAGESSFFRAYPVNGGNAPTYEWYRNNIKITGADKDTLTISNIADGDKILCKMVSNSSCVSSPNATSNEFTIKTIANLIPKLTLIAAKDTFCDGDVILINSTAQNGGSSPMYKWYLNGSLITGANSDAYFSNTLNTDDEITCEITSSLLCAVPKTANSNKIRIKIFKYVPTTISLTKNKNSICSDDYVTFTTTFTGGGLNPSVNWKVNGTQMNINKKFITVPISSTSDIVELTVKSSEPCVTPAFPTLYMSVDTVKQGPFVNVYPDKYIALCEGDSTIVRAFNGQPNYSYKWSNGSTKDSFWSKVTNSYTLTVTETGNVCPRYYGPLTTSVNPLPTKPQISIESGTLLSSLADRYQWQLNKMDIVSADSQHYKPMIVGNYRVKITNNAGCVNFSDEINPANSSITNNFDQFITIYPNPTNGIFSIKSHQDRLEEIHIYDIVGKTIYHKIISGQKHDVDISSIPKGNYFIHLKTNSTLIKEKIQIR